MAFRTTGRDQTGLPSLERFAPVVKTMGGRLPQDCWPAHRRATAPARVVTAPRIAGTVGGM